MVEAAKRRQDKRRAREEAEAMLVDKIRPRRIADVVGNTKSIQGVVSWARRAKARTAPIKALALVGPPGVGKSMSARLALTEAGFEHISEINASDVTSIWKLIWELQDIGMRGGSRTLAIIVEEVDGIVDSTKIGSRNNVVWTGWGNEESARCKTATALNILCELAASTPLTMVPVVFTANDQEKESVRKLLGASELYKFYPLDAGKLASYAKQFAPKETLRSISDERLQELAVSARGDARTFFNLLEFQARSGTDASFLVTEERRADIFSCLDRILFNKGAEDPDVMMCAYQAHGRIESVVQLNALRFIFDADRAVNTMEHLSDNVGLRGEYGDLMNSWGTWVTRTGGKSRNPPRFGLVAPYRFSRPMATYHAPPKILSQIPGTRTCTNPSDLELSLSLYTRTTRGNKDRCCVNAYGQRVTTRRQLTLAEAADPLTLFETSKEDVRKLSTTIKCK